MSWRDALTESQRHMIVSLWLSHPTEGCRKIAARATDLIGRAVGETTCKTLKPAELRRPAPAPAELARWVEADRRVRSRLGVGAWRKGVARAS